MLRGAATKLTRAARRFLGSQSPCAGALATAGRAHASSAHAAVLQQGARKSLPYVLAGVAALAFTPVAWAASSAEKSFIMIKPDGVQRRLVADIIKRFEQKGYKLVAIKVLLPSEELAGQHYQEHEQRHFYPGLVKFLSSGPVVAMVWQGKEVIKYGSTLIGATNPLASAPGTIRGDYGIDVGRNIIHGSDSTESAQAEIALWFKPEELTEYSKTVDTWIYE